MISMKFFTGVCFSPSSFCFLSIVSGEVLESENCEEHGYPFCFYFCGLNLSSY